jgi:hypothetical protein
MACGNGCLVAPSTIVITTLSALRASTVGAPMMGTIIESSKSSEVINPTDLYFPLILFS